METKTQSPRRISIGKRSKETKRVGKAAPLAPIVGLVSEDGTPKQPKSVRQILFNTKPEMSLLDLIAWSPSICQEVKRLATRAPSGKEKQGRNKKEAQNQKENKTSSGDVVVGLASVETDDAYTKTTARIGEDKAFRIPATVESREGTIELNQAMPQVDHGSDLYVIGKSLALRLGLALGELAEIGFKGMAMRVANGNITPLKGYAIVKVGVAGVWRTINCFVLPHEAENILPGSDIRMLLELPWLYSVDAVIGIRDGSIRIGDASANSRNDPSFFFTNKTGAAAGDELCRINPLCKLSSNQSRSA